MNKKIPILFSFRRCPYAMRARIAIKLCDLECEIREINLKLKHKEFLKISPKGTVPVLVLPDDKIIEDKVRSSIRSVTKLFFNIKPLIDVHIVRGL